MWFVLRDNEYYWIVDVNGDGTVEEWYPKDQFTKEEVIDIFRENYGIELNDQTN